MLSPEEIFHLKQPCKNRGLFLRVQDGDVTISGKPFSTAKDAEEYLMGVPRLDLSPEEKCQACISAQRDTGKTLYTCDECTYFGTLH